MTIAEFDLGITRDKGEVIRINDKTIVVRMDTGDTLKRHIEKHRVEMQEEE